MGWHLEGQIVLSQLHVNFSSQGETQVCLLASTYRVILCSLVAGGTMTLAMAVGQNIGFTQFLLF